MEYYLQSTFVFTTILLALAIILTIAERFLVNYGICQVDINAGEKTFEIEGGQTLLSALTENKVYIPSACGGQGTCGFCKCTVIDGGGPVLPTEKPFMNRQDIRSGIRLACQVKIRQDIQIKIPEDLLNVKMFNATVISNKSLTHDINEIRFRLNEPSEISQRPGQYIQIQAPSPDGPVFRAYSISSANYENDVVELGVRQIPDGICSTYLCNIEEGAEVTFTGPYGEFRLNEDPETEIICVGGGAGMSPMKNIIYSIYNENPDRTIWLFFGCRTTKDIFYLNEYKELAKKHPNFHVIYGLSDPLEPGEQWDGETGFIHLAVDKHLEKDIPRQAFLCGPPPMIEAVMRVLEEKGLPQKEIFYDKF